MNKKFAKISKRQPCTVQYRRNGWNDGVRIRSLIAIQADCMAFESAMPSFGQQPVDCRGINRKRRKTYSSHLRASWGGGCESGFNGSTSNLRRVRAQDEYKSFPSTVTRKRVDGWQRSITDATICPSAMRRRAAEPPGDYMVSKTLISGSVVTPRKDEDQHRSGAR